MGDLSRGQPDGLSGRQQPAQFCDQSTVNGEFRTLVKDKIRRVNGCKFRQNQGATS